MFVKKNIIVILLCLKKLNKVIKMIEESPFLKEINKIDVWVFMETIDYIINWMG